MGEGPCEKLPPRKLVLEKARTGAEALHHRHHRKNTIPTVAPANAGVYEKIKEVCLGRDGEIPAFAGMTREEEEMTGSDET